MGKTGMPLMKTTTGVSILAQRVLQQIEQAERAEVAVASSEQAFLATAIGTRAAARHSVN